MDDLKEYIKQVDLTDPKGVLTLRAILIFNKRYDLSDLVESMPLDKLLQLCHA